MIKWKISKKKKHNQCDCEKVNKVESGVYEEEVEVELDDDVEETDEEDD